MNPFDIIPDFKKYPDGLIPAIIRHMDTGQVLMLGYMNEAAWTKTLSEQRVTFFSRSRQCLWTKGETSGNYLFWYAVSVDCDKDALLFSVRPDGPVCHTGAAACFDSIQTPVSFLKQLETIIRDRIERPSPGSYTAALVAKGINKIAQKVGEEAVELIIEAKDDNRDLFCNEAADLLYHFLILLNARGVYLEEIEMLLQGRHINKS